MVPLALQERETLAFTRFPVQRTKVPVAVAVFPLREELAEEQDQLLL